MLANFAAVKAAYLGRTVVALPHGADHSMPASLGQTVDGGEILTSGDQSRIIVIMGKGIRCPRQAKGK